MKLSTDRDVAAEPGTVWALMSDVERWPEWTDSINSVERQTGQGLSPDAVFRLKQPGMPSLGWRVTAVDEGRSFAWEARSPGSTVVAVHTVEPREGGSHVRLDLEQTGLLGSLLSRLMAGRYRRFMDMEADGLKSRAEGDTG